MYAIRSYYEEHGLPARINRDFARLRRFYGRLLTATLHARPAVYLVWLAITLLTVPMFMMSARELAPTEDQGVIFGIIDGITSYSIHYTKLYEANHYRYLGQHDEVALAVVRGEFDFGGLKTAIAQKYTHLGLKVVAESPLMTGLALVEGLV